MTDETNVVLLLDLAIENPIHPDVVLGRLPAGGIPATVHRVTEFGAVPCIRGTPDDWAPVLEAIDRMVIAARSAERSGARCRYWVAGRAGLPAFVHLGYRLTKKALVTLVNVRDSGPVDQLRLDVANDSDSASQPYFERLPWPTRVNLAEVRVNLLVSSRIRVSPEQVETLMSSRGTPSAALMAAHAAKSLDKTTVVPALRELEETFVGIRSWYPGCGALALFIAGPVTLAFLVGRAINPYIFPDIQVFQHRDNQYQLAYETRPQPSKTKCIILFLAANPAGTDALDLGQEARAITQELKRGGQKDRFEFVTRWAAQPLDLLDELRKLKPTVVHFSGHGNMQGLCFQAADGLPQVVSREALTATFSAAGASVKVVVLNACNSESQAKDLCAHIKCVVGMSAKINNESARRFAIGFYGGLVEGESVKVAYHQGCAAIQLEGLAHSDLPQLIVQDGVDASKMILAGPHP